MLRSKLTRAIRKPFTTVRNRRELRHLRASDDPTTRAVGDASASVLGKRFEQAELMWQERIESLRSELLTCERSMSVVDYSAPKSEGGGADGGAYGRRMTTVAKACRASRGGPGAMLLLRLIRCLQPTQCIELGTNIGISAAYQGVGLELNDCGRLVSLEGDETKAKLAEEHWARLGLDRLSVVVGRFQDTLDGVLQGVGKVDFAFVDGHHDGDATVEYFQQIAAYASPGAVIVLDDTRWSESMVRGWSQIRTRKGLSLTVDYGRFGLCVVGHSDALPHHVSLRLS